MYRFKYNKLLNAFRYSLFVERFEFFGNRGHKQPAVLGGQGTMS